MLRQALNCGPVLHRRAATPEARRKTKDWALAEVFRALDSKARIIMLATPLDPESLAVDLSKRWYSQTYPIEEVNDKRRKVHFPKNKFYLLI